MTDLFDTKDLLTVATVEQAEVGTKGYFGDNLSNLIERVRQGKVETLTDVIPDVTYCFESNNDLHYVFFLPSGKVKEKVKEPVYRPFYNLDELFDFFVPDFDEEYFGLGDDDPSKYDTYKKIELLLGLTITLKRKEDNFIKAVVITGIHFYDKDHNKDIYINDNLITYLFSKYEILRNGEWVPFGIKE